jgi:hypothetical protein
MTQDIGQPTAANRIVALPWNVFLLWLSDAWHPSHHMAIVGPTGEGKTTFAVPVLKLRKWVMVLDAKGEDGTLEKSGFVRITKLPLPRQIRNDVAEGRAARIIVGGKSDSKEADAALRQLMREAIEMVRTQGGWTIYADEFQILADQRMYGLGKEIERLHVSARGKGTSVMSSFQAPAWVPKSATRQTTFAVMLPTRDINMIKAVAESMGREWKDLAKAVYELPGFHMLVVPKSPRAPMVLVHPPELK